MCGLNRKYILPVLVVLVIITAICCFIFVKFSNSPESNNSSESDNNLENIVITAPVQVVVGEMARLEVNIEANDFEWRVYPISSNFEIIEQGRRALFCSPEPGVYTFVVAMNTSDGLFMSDCKITVDSNIVQPNIVQPNIVQPNIVQPNITLDPFKVKVRAWLPSNSDPIIVEKLAQSFESNAKMNHKDVPTLILMTAQRNRTDLGKSLAQYKPFLVAVSTYLKGQKLTTLDEHREIWLKIAAALR